jgi:hypothetical protein
MIITMQKAKTEGNKNRKNVREFRGLSLKVLSFIPSPKLKARQPIIKAPG